MKKSYDLLIIGSGIGGLSAAISAAEEGKFVLVINKSPSMEESNTWYAQGGIVETGEGDSPELLVKDILEAGAYLNNRRAVEIVAEEGPEYVQEYLIEKAQVPFARGDKGLLDRTREGAHSVRRILHVNDQTGRSIEEYLLKYAQTFKEIVFHPDAIAVDIITNTHHSSDTQQRYQKKKALGAYVLEGDTGNIEPIFSHATIIATGGVGNLFLHTSNPKGATGDGIAMAYRAGCEIINAEYIQFHPTILYHRDIKRFLISESLRGEGARLMNTRGEYFMERYNPEMKDLASRDEVARAIYAEMDSNGGYVYLDARGITDHDLSERFPGIYQQCKSIGIDINTDPIPVVPAAHYFCGGIKVDQYGETEIPGLYALGESAGTGVHGANRLASVSLLEALVFGIRAGKKAAENLNDKKRQKFQSAIETIPPWIYPNREIDFDPLLMHHDLQNIQATMWNYVGIMRNQRRLDRALSDLSYFHHRIEKFYTEARATAEIIALRNAVLTATIITRSAKGNKTSLGCHFRQEVEENGCQ